MAAPGVGYTVELDIFEGPLDLLLHLVRKHELDILDIPIAFITEKYLEYLDLMKALSLDIAGEYLLMAATLAYIKSRELLPPEPDEEGADEDGEGEGEAEIDPRADLIRRLLEYQKYKDAGHKLGGRPVVGRNVWTRGAATEDVLPDNIDLEVMAPLVEFPVIKLMEALNRALERARVKISHEVSVERLSVSQRINQLTDRLETEGGFTFLSCFSFLKPGVIMTMEEIRHEAVVTFLAILEMGKLRLIRISQGEGEDDDIFIASATENLRERVAQTVVSDDEYR